ncbi:37872_t:CDS:2, partial [Gigaspora margarita]
MLKQIVINLLNGNNFSVTTKKYKKYKFLKASFRKYCCYLIIWDKKTINEKNLIDIEEARSTICQNENKNGEFLTLLVYNSNFENNLDKALVDIYGKGCINPKIPRTNFFAKNEKKIINLLKDNIYDNCAISKNIHDKRVPNLKVTYEYNITYLQAPKLTFFTSEEIKFVQCLYDVSDNICTSSKNKYNNTEIIFQEYMIKNIVSIGFNITILVLIVISDINTTGEFYYRIVKRRFLKDTFLSKIEIITDSSYESKNFVISKFFGICSASSNPNDPGNTGFYIRPWSLNSFTNSGDTSNNNYIEIQTEQ